MPIDRIRVLTLALLLSASPLGRAHDSLYQYLEIHCEPSGEVAVLLTAHAAEFSADPDVDPASVETQWFEALSREEQQALIAKANAFLQVSFGLHLTLDDGSQAPLPIPKILPSAPIDAEARPGSFTAEGRLPANAETLTVTYGGEKRLLVALIRPGMFPNIRDLAPGSRDTFALPPKHKP